MSLASQKKIGGNHVFFRENQASKGKKSHTLLYILALFRDIVA